MAISKCYFSTTKFIFALLFVLLSSSFSFSENNNNISEKLLKAEQAYKEKKYPDAIALYLSVINDNYQSFELYYNLGNAYFKNNQLGKAILYYEKAKLLNPSDEDLNHNLKLAYNKTIDKIETKDNFFIEITKTSFLNKLNTNLLSYITIILSFLAFISFSIFLFNNNFRKLTLSLTIIFIILNFIIYITAHFAEKNKHQNNFAIVTNREVKVTNEPLPEAITKFKLHEGTKVKILQKVDNFYLIRLENGVEGWIEQNSVEII